MIFKKGVKMEVETYVKDTLGLIVAGVIFLIIFGWLLKQSYSRFDFNQNGGKFVFLIENYRLVGGFLIGVLLFILAII